MKFYWLIISRFARKYIRRLTERVKKVHILGKYARSLNPTLQLLSASFFSTHAASSSDFKMTRAYRNFGAK